MITDAKLYIVDKDTGKPTEVGPLQVLTITSEDGYTETYTRPQPADPFSFSLLLQPKVKARLYGLTNNCIRLHGGRPMRTIKHRYMKEAT